MEQNEISMFELNENGQIIYDPAEGETVGEGDIYAGSDIIEGDDLGDLSEDPLDVPENDLEIEEETPEMVLPLTDDGYMPVVLSEEVTAAILGDSPATGSLASSTLDYFDRIVSGLPQNYKYVAYRTSTDDSYDGVLYFGQFFDIDGNSITFGKDAKEIVVDRSSGSSYNNVTNYYVYDAEDVTIEYEQDGAVVFYTNAAVGYPVLGGFSQNVSYTPFILAALIGAFVTVIFNKLMKGR